MNPMQLHAQPTGVGVNRTALLGLAEQFVEKVEAGFAEADSWWTGEPIEEEDFYEIPDGTLLLLQISIRKEGQKRSRALRFPEPVVAIKQGEDVMVSLFDFTNVARFAIDVKPAEGIAEGWFISQERKFLLDANQMQIVADDEEYQIEPNDIEVGEFDILIKSTILAEIFDFDATVILARQYLEIMPEDKWPAIAKLERDQRLEGIIIPPPKLPRLEEPYPWVRVPNVDISTSVSLDRPAESRNSQLNTGYSAVYSGPLLGHTARIVTSGGKSEWLEAARATFRRQSDEPELLGWLGARRYEFGDIGGSGVPGASGGGGVGFYATNANPYITTDAFTTIEGDITPGWDAELYRGPQYLDIQTNIEDGRYEFEDVELAGGVNNFIIKKFGPLGEIEEEEIIVYSTPRLLEDERGIFEVSLNLKETELWTRIPSESPDKYTPVVAGTWEYPVTDNVSVKVGAVTSQQNEEQKTFGHIGTAAYMDGVYFNAGVTGDLDGSYLADTSLRTTFNGHSLNVGAGYTAENFGATNEGESLSSYEYNASLRGPLPEVNGRSLANYAVNTTYTENEDGFFRRRSRLNLSRRIANLGVSSTVTHSEIGTDNNSAEAISGLTGITGRIGRTRWRFTGEYSIKPEWLVNAYNLTLSRGLARNLSGALSLSNDPNSDFTTGQAVLNWSNEHITVSPSITYDSENNFGALLNTSFGIAHNSYTDDIVISRRDVINYGAVAAFVYLDVDGDRQYTEGLDEPIRDAIVEAIQSKRTAVTDEKGEAFLFDLPTNTITDIQLNEFSFFDPFWVPGFEGVSVRPRAGHEARIEFPVHRGGEVDGTVYIQPSVGGVRPVRNVRLHLYDMEGRLVDTVTAAYDGFYLFTKIHPGRYQLVVDAKDAENLGLVRPKPQELEFTYEGTIIYSNNVTLTPKDDEAIDVPYTFLVDHAPYLGMNPDHLGPALLQGRTPVLDLGTYNSRLLMMLTWYRLYNSYTPLVGDTEIVVPPAESVASLESGTHNLLVRTPDGTTMEEAFQRCRALMARQIYCRVTLTPHVLKEASADTAGRG